MKTIKEYIGDQFIGKIIHFSCDCIFPIDVTGRCVGYDIINNEIILNIDVKNKILKFGENHPKLHIEIIES